MNAFSWIEVTKAVPSVVTAGCAVWGLLIAKAGLDKWHRETIGKRKAELAEQALASMYEVRDVFQWVRARVVFVGEGEARTPEKDESGKLKTRRDRYSIPIERLQRDKELFARLQSQRYTFMAYFGQEAAKPFVTIGEVHQDIVGAASILIEMAHAEDFETPYTPDIQELRKTIGWGPQKRPDDIDHKIEQAVLDVETVCRPVLIAHSIQATRGFPDSSLFAVSWLRRP